MFIEYNLVQRARELSWEDLLSEFLKLCEMLICITQLKFIYITLIFFLIYIIQYSDNWRQIFLARAGPYYSDKWPITSKPCKCLHSATFAYQDGR